VSIRDLRLADDLGGKGYVLFGGVVAEVEAAVGYGLSRIEGSGQALGQTVIARLHDGMRENLVADPRFGSRASDVAKTEEASPVPVRPPTARAHRPMPGSGTSTRSTVPAPAGASRPEKHSKRKKA
jgi:microcompartment protein CcmL/EutN